MIGNTNIIAFPAAQAAYLQVPTISLISGLVMVSFPPSLFSGTLAGTLNVTLAVVCVLWSPDAAFMVDGSIISIKARECVVYFTVFEIHF